MAFEVPHPDIELPPGDAPLVLVAPSTAHDSENQLVRTALAALAEEPVRVVATTNRVRPQSPIEVPANAVLVDWLSYSQLMPIAALVISHGGHGTVARALGAGTPVLISPITGDMGETAMRISWAGVGLSFPGASAVPARCAGPPAASSPTRAYAARARQIAAWGASTTAPTAARNWSSSWPVGAGPQSSSDSGAGSRRSARWVRVPCHLDVVGSRPAW